MKKTLKVLAGILAALTVTAAFTSCGKSAWETDFDKAKAKANKANKEIMLLISGDDWDEYSAESKTKYFNTKEFAAAYGKDYVWVNVDFSQNEFAKTQVMDPSDKKAVKEAERIEALYQKKMTVAQGYNLTSYPAFYILSKEGFVLQTVEFGFAEKDPETEEVHLEDYAVFVDKINLAADARNEKRDQINKINAAKGLEKAQLIDTFYNSTEPMYLRVLEPLVKEFITLDPENETGLLGNYQLYGAYMEAQQTVLRDAEAASEVFVKVCESPALSNAQKQEAYYSGAYMLVIGNSTNFNRMRELLNKAIEMDPESSNVADLMQALGAVDMIEDRNNMMIQQMQEQAAAAAAQAQEAPVEN